ncbi:MAG: hypothetical protein JNK49_05815 [Planctomycetes bacterium]|nr:hypothetical protein [Planctomycetota bacterium]
MSAAETRPEGEPDPRTGRPARYLKMPPLQVEHTHWSPALLGFYVSCAGVALGATFASAGPLLFGSTTALVLGSLMSAVSAVGCFVTLRAARRAGR